MPAKVPTVIPQLTQQITSKQPERTPQELKRITAVAPSASRFQQIWNPVQVSIPTQPSRSDSQIKTLAGKTTEITSGLRIVAPLVSPSNFPITQTDRRTSEHINGWGGITTVFLDLFVELGIFFASAPKWLSGASRARWETLPSNHYTLAVDGVSQWPSP